MWWPSTSIKTKERSLILNKSKEKSDTLNDEINKSSLNLKTILPFDKELEDAAVNDRSIFDLDDKNPVLNAIKELFPSRMGIGCKER